VSTPALAAVKYRLYPTRAQATRLAETLETCRRLYNRFLAERKDASAQGGAAPSYHEQKRALPGWKTESEWLRRVNAQALQDVALRVERSFAGYFRRSRAGGVKPGAPRFKGKGWYDSFTLPQEGAFRTHDDGVTLSKIGRVRAVVHRPLPGRAKTLTVRRQNGKWYACVACEVTPAALRVSDESVGIDVGLAHFATLSTGDTIDNPRFLRRDQRALAKAQRRLAKEPSAMPLRAWVGDENAAPSSGGRVKRVDVTSVPRAREPS
jgi:putative transposase